jgi:hypothetical protein
MKENGGQRDTLRPPLIRVNPGSIFRVGVDFHFGGLVNFFKKN